MKRRRCRYDILAEVLRAIKETDSTTFVMYRANLSYTSARDYIRYALKNGLVEKKDNVLTVTSLGEKYLMLYEEVKRLLGEDIG